MEGPCLDRLRKKKVAQFTLSDFKEALQYLCCDWNSSAASKDLHKYTHMLELRFSELVCAKHSKNVLDVSADVETSADGQCILADHIVRDTFATLDETVSLLHLLYKMHALPLEGSGFHDIFLDYASCDVEERTSMEDWFTQMLAETEDMNEVSQAAVTIYEATNTFPGEYSKYLRENNYIESERVEEVWSYNRTRLELVYLKKLLKGNLADLTENVQSPHTHDYRLLDSFYTAHMHYYLSERHSRFKFCSMALIFSKDLVRYHRRLNNCASPVVINILGEHAVFFAGTVYSCENLKQALYGWMFLLVYACNKEFSTESDNFILKKVTL